MKKQMQQTWKNIATMQIEILVSKTVRINGIFFFRTVPKDPKEI